MNPYNTSALEPPPGVIPNYNDPPTIAGALVAGLAIMIATATLAFAARVFTKVYVMKQVQLDDYALILGWAFFIVYQACIIAQTPYSTGRHQWDVSKAQMADFRQFLNYSEILYCCCMIFTKIAILLQLKRIFRGASKDSVYWLLVVLMVISTLYYLTGILIEILQCQPREKIWDPSIPGSCIDNNVSVTVAGAFNLGLDLIIFMTPIYAILKLKIAVKRKLGICAIFATGLLACISSLLRLYYSVQLIRATDVTYEDASLSWSASLEGASAILVASFPVMPRLYQFFRGDKTRTAASSPNPSYPPKSGSGFSTPSSFNSRPLRASIGRFSMMAPKTTPAADDDEKQLRRDWAPPAVSQGYGLTNAEIRRASERLSDIPQRDIRKTVMIETKYEVFEPRSAFED